MTTMSCKNIARCPLPGEGQVPPACRASVPPQSQKTHKLLGTLLPTTGLSLPWPALICSGPGVPFLSTDMLARPSKDFSRGILEGTRVAALEIQGHGT